MAEPERHALVTTVPAPSPAGLPSDFAAAWQAAGRPLVVRRRMPSDPADHAGLGLALPPSHGKTRLSLCAPRAELRPVPLPDTTATAPAGWRPTLRGAAALARAHGLTVRPYGALLWQAATGLTYLHATSDLDLLWHSPAPVSSTFLSDLAALAAAAPMSLDGEIVVGGAGVQWRELASGTTEVLARTLAGAALRPAREFARP